MNYPVELTSAAVEKGKDFLLANAPSREYKKRLLQLLELVYSNAIHDGLTLTEKGVVIARKLAEGLLTLEYHGERSQE